MLHHKFIGNSESNQVIIFLHEGLGCIEMWRDYPEQLCNKLNCRGLIYDLKLENKEIILYGHSDGGSIALIYASKYPNQVKSVITEAAHVFVEDVTLAGIAPAKEAFLQGKLDGLKKYHGNHYVEVFNAWVDIWNDPDFRDWNIEAELKQITCLQLVIQGVNDEYGTLKQVESIANHTKGQSTRFTPDNCGHAPFKELTTEVLKEVEAFVKNI